VKPPAVGVDGRDWTAMSPAVEHREHHRRFLVAVVLSVLALVVGVGVSVDAHASSSGGQVAGTRVAGQELLAGPVVAASENITPGEGRRTTTLQLDVAIGSRVAPNTATRYLIGGMEDLGAGSLRAGEATVASRLPGNAGNRLGNWLNNRDVLRSIMREGRPIRDASVDSAGNLLYQDTRRFITLERDFLRSHRWTYDPSTNLWMPPG
jgi:hypothetical protein